MASSKKVTSMNNKPKKIETLKRKSTRKHLMNEAI